MSKNTNNLETSGLQFDKDTIKQVWNKGDSKSSLNFNVFRKDKFGAWIKKDQYNNSDSVYGWKIVDVGNLKNNAKKSSNLVPIHYKNEVQKNNDHQQCNVISLGTTNVRNMN